MQPKPKRKPTLRVRVDQWLWTIGSLIVALVPTWVFILAYKLGGHPGFLAILIIGIFQTFVLFAWVVFMVVVVWSL